MKKGLFSTKQTLSPPPLNLFIVFYLLNVFRIKKNNQKQFELMGKLLEKNPQLAKGMTPFGSTKKTRIDFWEDIAVELNNIGPPLRRGSEWNKVWLDYKLKLKKKISNNRRETVATGGGPYTQRSLTPLEQAVDDLFSLQDAVNPSGSTFGNTAAENLEESITHVDVDEVQPEQVRENLNVNVTPRQARITGVEERETLRMKALEKQAQTQESLVDLLHSIKSETKEIGRYTRKMYELKKEKL
ncbi:uncharacterized protein LOC105220215 [Zeugodacus cucurbitae]|uniref:uncharacterized protein LOC105220215 n=1 Tax=Zeugodacus cucurbitae TaxID=28588 RepID=UPI0023D936F3|nr:uncharacterized protein LOC105220215 [Zeugodacus cucurbitae]